MKLLHIDSSILGAGSASRALTAELVATLRARHPGIEVTYRDLAAAPLQHLTGQHLAGDPATDVAEGTAALEEFLAADLIVIGAPMYNFSIPSQLKSWLDRLTVAGKTFRYTENGVEGLVLGKKLYIASTRGAQFAGTPLEVYDHQESYLKAVLGFLGVTDITFTRAEGMAREQLREKSLAEAKAQIAALAA